MINFYSTKRNGNVEIPSNKVCGVRIPNSYMKKNYSDGVRAGLNNGVVNQRLSRFSTEAERKEATSNCAGNVNWLNYKVGETFNPPENVDRQFNIKRPAFNAGTVSRPKSEGLQNSINDINQRGGLGNKRIVRPRFMSPPITARLPLDFEKLQLMNIQEAGENIKNNENKLGYTTSIQIPDPTDFKWLREQERLRGLLTAQFQGTSYNANEITAMVEKELSINKPFGREQRTITSTTNDIAGDNRMSVKNKLTKIIQEVADGRAESRTSQMQITQQITDILQQTTEIERLSTLQLTGLGQSLARIGIPSSYKALGIVPRFVDNDFYNNNAGIINLLLFSKVRNEPNTRLYNYDKLVKNFPAEPITGLPTVGRNIGAMKLTTMVTALGRTGANRLFLDLERGGVISQEQLRKFTGVNPNNRADVSGDDYAIDPNKA